MSATFPTTNRRTAVTYFHGVPVHIGIPSMTIERNVSNANRVFPLTAFRRRGAIRRSAARRAVNENERREMKREREREPQNGPR